MNSIDTRKASDSIAEATVSLFDSVDMLCMGNPLRARQIFASEPSNRLTLAMLGPCAIFGSIYQKFSSAEFTKLIGPDPSSGKLYPDFSKFEHACLIPKEY